MIVEHQPTEVTADSLPEIEVTKKLLHSNASKLTSLSNDTLLHDAPAHTSRVIHMNYSRLPKLSLPTFDGNPLQWQTFWDSFSAAVDSNPCLTGVQKFNYLHSQLHSDASRVISGFPLSDSNYSHSLELLKERFCQQHKLVDTHMDVLLNISSPSNNLASLHTFYDTLQSHIRALDKPSHSYGPLFTTAILGKLPSDIKMLMACDHYNAKWTIDKLLTTVRRYTSLRLVFLLDTNTLFQPQPPYMQAPTRHFLYAGTHKAFETCEKPKRDPVCALCKGMHKTSSCTSVTSPKKDLRL